MQFSLSNANLRTWSDFSGCGRTRRTRSNAIPVSREEIFGLHFLFEQIWNFEAIVLVGTHGLREGGTLRIVICQISPSTIKPDNHLLVSQLYETASLTRSICLVSLLS